MYEEGKRIIDIAQMYGKASSTIATILLALKKKRLEILNEVGNLLLVWVNENQLAGDTINETSISEKARVLYDLIHRTPQGLFKASRCWFHKFNNRTDINCTTRHGEVASADKKAAEEFVKEFKRLVESEGYIAQ